MRAILTTCALLLAAPSWAADLVIAGPAAVKPYKVVRLSADGVDPKSGLVWRVTPAADVDKVTAPRGRFEFVAPPGVYEVSLLVVRLSADGSTDIEEATKTLTIAPPPTPVPPGPGPGPVPIPPGPVVPSDPTKLFIVGVDETEEGVAERARVFTDPALNARVKEKGHKYRLVDQNVQGVDGQPPADVKRFLDLAKGSTLPRVFLVDEKGKVRYSGVWPKTADLLQLIINAGG